MDFDLSPQQQQRVDHIRAGACKLPAMEPNGMAGKDSWLAAAELGMTGLCLPTDHGGGGLGALDTALCLEAFCAGGADTGLAFGIAAHLLACGTVLADHAGEPVRAELLQGLASGTVIAANAMTEDDAGSDLSRLTTTAVADGDSYVLNGKKSFVSNAPLADVFITYVATAPSAGYLGMSAFAVPRTLPGLRVDSLLAKMGLNGCAAAQVKFTDCKVPGRYLLGPENQGNSVFQRSMTWERACLPAIYLGAMEGQLAQCVDHARSRKQFGRSIGNFQAISHRLATMKLRLETSRLLLYRACWYLDQGRPAVEAAALAKTAVAEAAVANALDAVQVFGARGYLAADGIGQQLQNAIPLNIFSGTTEMQREVVAKSMGL
ncbi:acyl-CoA dehydrogenase family protein [Streptomyces sp. NPDC060000]|uniref:acyl-CoA dehydrogenase family protein n=1 Tax=Streptomyces sp. NPDC060000 TaxID=3347031 RepID=UPI0036C04C23